MDYKKTGEMIKEYRKKAGLTQQELADKIGKSLSSVKKYEAGLTEIPYSVLDSIISVLNAPLLPFLPSIQNRGGNIVMPVSGGVFEGSLEDYQQYMQAASFRSFGLYVKDKGLDIDLKTNTISFDGKTYLLTTDQVKALPDISIDMIKAVIKASAKLNTGTVSNGAKQKAPFRLEIDEE